jgi:formate hydrogenlyase subunit 5
MSVTNASKLDDVRREIEAGARLAWIFAETLSGTTTLHYVVHRAGRLRDTTVLADGSVPSLAESVPGARWYEREARDRFGIAFDGLSDTRPLVRVVEPEQLQRIDSPEVSTILYGPIRSGITESARWNVTTAGEDFINVSPVMFYKHRGVEGRFIGVPLELAPFVAEHASGATASSHAAAFCKAVERALRIDVTPRARAARAILVEFERIHQHLDSLAKLADDGSLSVGSSQTYAAKERVHRLLAEATGNRFARGTICIGGVRFDVFGRLQEVCTRELERVERHARSVVDSLVETPSLVDRLIGTGRLSRDLVVAYGGVGPIARGSGVTCDARVDDGYLFTPLAGEEALEEGGDAMSRTLVRVAEIHRSFQLIRNALDAAPAGSWLAERAESDGAALARVESPQGELIYFVRVEKGAMQRIAIRSASFANWPLFVPSLPGNIFTDFSFNKHSFGLLQTEADR